MNTHSNGRVGLLHRSCLGGLLALVLLPALAWAAVGDTVITKDADFDTADVLDLAAPAGQEVIYQTLDHGDAIEVWSWDGTVEALLLSYTGAGLEPVFLRVTETERYRIKAGSGAANNKWLRATGVRVK